MDESHRFKILEALYQSEYQYRLSANEIERRIGVRWQNLRKDAQYLASRGYISMTDCSFGDTTYVMLELLPQGIDVLHGKPKEYTLMTTILFLAADPTNEARLRLGEESREIHERLQLAKLRDFFELVQRWSVRSKDLGQALLDVKPQFVHFSGHSTSHGELCLEDVLGRSHPVEPDALAALFALVADHVQCVVLNACYTEPQANAIARHIPYVIGMSNAIGDKAAIAFAAGFYQGLGGGLSIEDAFEFGRVQIWLEGIPEHLTPVLIKRAQD